jgi:hypothetical protein
MTYLSRDHEEPYIDSCEQDHIAEREAEHKMETLWTMLTDEDGAAMLAAKHNDSYDVAGVLLSMVAGFRYNENLHINDVNVALDVRKSERDADRVIFVNHLFDAVEKLFKEAL